MVNSRGCCALVVRKKQPVTESLTSPNLNCNVCTEAAALQTVQIMSVSYGAVRGRMLCEQLYELQQLTGLALPELVGCVVCGSEESVRNCSRSLMPLLALAELLIAGVAKCPTAL